MPDEITEHGELPTDAELWKWLMWRHGLETDEQPATGEMELFAGQLASALRFEAMAEDIPDNGYFDGTDVEICRLKLRSERDYATRKRTIGLPLTESDLAALGEVTIR